MSEQESFTGGFAPFELFFKKELILRACKDTKLKAKTHLLPTLSKLWDSEEEPFADVLLGYSSLGLYADVSVQTEKISVHYPEIEKGDAIQLFIDTRNVSSAKTTHRFCHHFFFLPEAFEGITQGEITRFRTEDSHPHCDPNELQCSIVRTKKGYSASIYIPADVLVGYSPDEYNRIGFTYTISRSDGLKQHFAHTSNIAGIEFAPYLWASFRLTAE